MDQHTVEPLFMKERDMPSADLPPYTVVKAIISRISPDQLDGVQRVGQLCRIYLKSLHGRLDLMTRKSLITDGKSVALYEQNPFKINLQSPDDKKDKLTIKGLPISVSNDEVVNLLKSKGITLATQVKFANIRDDNGSLTSYRNGARFVYCQPFSPSLPRQ